MNDIVMVMVQWQKRKDFVYDIHFRYSYVHFLPRVLLGYIMFLADATSSYNKLHVTLQVYICMYVPSIAMLLPEFGTK